MALASRRTARAERPEVDVSPMSEHVGFLLRIAQQNVFAEFHRLFAARGLTPARYSVLALLERNPAAHQSALADALRIKQPNFSVLVDAMEAEGMLRRTIDADNRRANRLSLTAKGKSLFDDTAPAVRQMERAFAQQLDGTEYQLLLRALRGFVDP